MQCKLSEKRKLALIVIISIGLTFCFLANNSSKPILPDDSESFNAEHENYFELLNTANPTNLDIVNEILDSKSADISSNGYYAQLYSDSLQATYYVTISVNASLIFAEGAEPVYDGNISAKIHREGVYIGWAEFSSENFANYTYFNLTYIPDTLGNYSFETYLSNNYHSSPQLLNYTTFSYEYDPPDDFIDLLRCGKS